MNAAVNKTKLVLKHGISLNVGEKKKKKKKKKKRKRKLSNEDVETEKKKGEETVELKKITGSGTIIVSGTTVTGTDTKFKKEIRVGDIFGIVNPVSTKEEVKIVRFILSDTHLSISSVFSNDIFENVPYFYISQRKTKSEDEEAKDRDLKRMKSIESATGRSTARWRSRKLCGTGP